MKEKNNWLKYLKTFRNKLDTEICEILAFQSHRRTASTSPASNYYENWILISNKAEIPPSFENSGNLSRCFGKTNKPGSVFLW